MKNANLLVEHQCPQCGAPAVLEETERFFICPFCRVQSYLMHNGYFSYYLPARTPDRHDLFYLPYWRFKGMCFTNQSLETTSRFIDTTQQAINVRSLPNNLGFRPQTMKMRFLQPDAPGQFATPRLRQSDALQMVEKRLHSSNHSSFHQYFIGETVSIIYAPFYGTDDLYDGVLERPLGVKFDPKRLILADSDRLTAQQLLFAPTLCPACGWDMTGHKDSFLLKCFNCSSAWMATGKGFKRISFQFWHSKHRHLADFFLPFWRIKAKLMDIRLETYADLIRRANLPKTAEANWEKRNFHFWIPAFKIKPQRFLTLSTSLTLSQPLWSFIEGIPATPIHPVSLPIKEAIACLPLTLGEIVKPRKNILNKLPQTQITPTSALLVFLPFQERYHEYICPELHLALDKNVLSHAGNL